MDYGTVGTGPIGASTGQGVGAGGVSFLAMVQRFCLPLQVTLNLPVAPTPAAAGFRAIAPAFSVRFSSED
jgi:hypothetical protein